MPGCQITDHLLKLKWSGQPVSTANEVGDSTYWALAQRRPFPVSPSDEPLGKGGKGAPDLSGQEGAYGRTLRVQLLISVGF